jgi:hypothetical protein
MLRIGERYISSTERIRRIKEAGYIRLDAKIFQTVMENLHRVPNTWKEKMDGKTMYINFDGTIFLQGCGEYRPSDLQGLCLYHSSYRDHWKWYSGSIIVPNIYGEDTGIHNDRVVSAVLIP